MLICIKYLKTNNIIIDQNTEKSDLTSQVNRRWTFERKKCTLWAFDFAILSVSE